MSVEVIEGNLTGFEGITHYKRRREEQGGDAFLNGLGGITHYKRRREEQGGDAFLNGITPYRRYREERDGWTQHVAFPTEYGSRVRAEVEDGYRNAPAVNGLSDAIMTIEGLSALFSFPHMGKLEQALAPSPAEAAPASPVAKQIDVLNDLVKKRRDVIIESDAHIKSLLATVKDLDDQIEKLSKMHKRAAGRGDTAAADGLDAKATGLDRERSRAAKRAVRYAKLRVLAATLARNAKTQIGLANLAQQAASTGDKQSAVVLAQAFKEIGDSTAKIHSLRQEQQAAWKAEDAPPAASGTPIAPLPELSESVSIPAIWASGDLRAELAALYKKIDSLKKQGAGAPTLQPYYDRAYNLRRMVEETRGQGLTGVLSTIGGGIKSAYNATAGAVKTVANAGVKLGKFAACGVLAKPGVASTVGAVGGTIAAPGAGTAVGGAAGAATGAVFGAACGTGKQGQMAAQQAGIDPYLVSGNPMQKPIVGGVRLWHVLVGAGTLLVGGLGYMAFRRQPAMAGIDPMTAYGFRGLNEYEGTKRKGKKRGGKRKRKSQREMNDLANAIYDSFKDTPSI